MTYKPSEAIRQLLEEAKKQPTKTAGHEVAARTAAKITWMHEYLLVIEDAIKRSDLTTFADAKRERVFAKDELAALSELLRQAEEWIAR